MDVRDWERVHYGEGSKEGERLLEAAQDLNLYILNTHIQKNERHRVITFNSGDVSSMIDFVMMVRNGDLKYVRDCKVIPSENWCVQHIDWLWQMCVVM